MLQDLGDQKGVQGRLVVPDLAVKVITRFHQRGLRELKILLGADLHGRRQRQQALQQNESQQQQAQGDFGVRTFQIPPSHSRRDPWERSVCSARISTAESGFARHRATVKKKRGSVKAPRLPRLRQDTATEGRFVNSCLARKRQPSAALSWAQGGKAPERRRTPKAPPNSDRASRWRPADPISRRSSCRTGSAASVRTGRSLRPRQTPAANPHSG